ncbi:GM12466 [Drosophila sechellia]|uniref:GM12466 n=1 Tax=Drosophila sechellia TaxID=7238 RepID=B4I0E7_DROSE|nr:GM12466 [Drosophila sechellia]
MSIRHQFRGRGYCVSALIEISGNPGYGRFGSPDDLDELDDEVCEESPSSELQLPSSWSRSMS